MVKNSISSSGSADLPDGAAAAAPAATPDGNAGAEGAGTDPAAAHVEVAVLVDHLDYKVDQIIRLSADEAAVAATSGWADPNPEAVAFAKRRQAQA